MVYMDSSVVADIKQENSKTHTHAVAHIFRLFQLNLLICIHDSIASNRMTEYEIRAALWAKSDAEKTHQNDETRKNDH